MMMIPMPICFPRPSLRAAAVLAAAALASCAPAPRPAPAPTVDALQSLVAAEAGFAAAVARDGIRDGFIRYAAVDAITFRPEPVDARAWWSARPPEPGTLVWHPSIARVSRRGDLGYTTGPFIARGGDGRVVSRGHFLTVWRYTGDGWRYVVDVGTVDADTARSYPAVDPDARSGHPPAVDRDVAPDGSLAAADSAFASRAASGGLAAALREFGDARIRFLRDRHPPADGLERAVAQASADSARRYTARPLRADASSTGDLGWTMGEYQYLNAGAGRRETGHYVRVWTRAPGDRWRVILDIVAPRPSERDE